MTNSIPLAIREFVLPLPRCPRCGNEIDLDAATYDDYSGPLTCPHCRGRMAVEIFLGRLGRCSAYIDPELAVPIDVGEHEADGTHILPLYWFAYGEAFTCLQGGAFRAAAVMCRLAMEHALRDLGVPDGDTAKMIAYANGHGILQGKYKHMARSVGFFGGKGAHAQFEEAYRVGQTEAIQGLRIVRDLLLGLFPKKTKLDSDGGVDPDDLPFE